MGRRKIEIEPITDERNRTVTFVKRKAGLFKKAHELAVLCQVDLAVIILGNNSKVYEYSSVDTDELLKTYKHIDIKYEAKSPEDYGGYKKKKHVGGAPLMGNIGDYANDEDEDSEADYDSSTPPRRKKRKRELEPSIPIRIGRPYGESDQSSVAPPAPPQVHVDHVAHQRPVLRVQIPSDVKGKIDDSAKTITAIDVTRQETPDNSNLAVSDNSDRNANGNTTPSIRTKYLDSFKPNDSHKPTLPLPVQSKNQLSPSSATAPGLPASAMAPGFYGPLPQPLPVGGPTSGQPYQWQVPGGPPSAQHSPSTQNLPKMPNPPFNNYNKLRPLHGQQYPVSVHQPSGAPVMGAINNNSGGDQTPQSGLPSRYVDLFPSPSNFYPPQDWPQPGMTPMTNGMPQYFNMISLRIRRPPRSTPQQGKLEPLPSLMYEVYDKKKE